MELWGVFVAIFLGALIGLQREYSQQIIHSKKFAGFRTFILITFFGAILGFLSSTITSALVLVGFGGMILLTSLSYLFSYLKEKSTTATTEISAILAYLLGAMCTTGYLEFAVIFGILILTFLTFKERLHEFVKKMQEKEIYAIVKFALISLVVLPLLPNKNYSPLDIPGFESLINGLHLNSNIFSQLSVFNPHQIWLFVILITGINFVGYFLIKLIGTNKGYGALGFVGGLVSSTALTLSMAAQSKKNNHVFFPFVFAIMIANSIMFVRVLFEISIINSLLLKTLILPLIFMFGLSLMSVFVFPKKYRKTQNLEKIEIDHPFAMKPALRFAFFFFLITLISKIALVFIGSRGLYLTGILSGFVDVDAITLSMATLSGSGEVSFKIASTTILLALISNTLVKSGMAYLFGNKKVGRILFLISFIVLSLGAGLFWIF